MVCQRVKYADDPSKFVDSELELFSEVEAFRAVAAAPHLYPELVALNAVNSLLGNDTQESEARQHSETEW